LFAGEIIPIKRADGEIVQYDGCIRATTTLQALAELQPAFLKNGSVTAGTSSPLTDGAAAVLVCCEDYADANGLEKLARIKAIAVSGCAPEIMGMGPVEATHKALRRAGLTLQDINIVELNEAFAAQSLAVLKDLPIPLEKLNLDGGAIALGHPLGASGARITGKAASLLKRENKQFALATQCIGGGQGIATILEAI
jgi:Acetyl-CoA acetyltransferase